MIDTQDRIELKVSNPVPDPDSLTGKSWFALYLPTNISTQKSFDAVREAVEFRRKCMNQGFDNLLELLAMTEKNILADVEAKKKESEETTATGREEACSTKPSPRFSEPKERSDEDK